MADRRDRKGKFRLIELLTLITIACLVFALVASWVPGRHSRSRQLECLNNMRNIAASLLSYELVNRRYPGYSNPLRLDDGTFCSNRSSG